MYTPFKDKYTPSPSSSPVPYTTVRRILPRYAKAYLWLGFLVFLFGLMLLSDNEISVIDLLPGFKSSSTVHDTTATKTGPITLTIATAPTASHETTKGKSVTLSGVDDGPTSTPDTAASVTKPSEDVRTPNRLVYGTGEKAFSPEDVVVLFKTGATALWRRVPMHLSTSFADKAMTPNIVLYSDQADSIAGLPIIDTLVNISASLKRSADFKLYRSLPTVRPSNQYLESANMEGDHYLPGGWRLDKYKFLPLIAHAAASYPGKKWYIYMEDDNYFFWHSIYTWLGSNFSPSMPHFLGAPAARLGEDFAHGGSGFIISGAALSQTFGADPDLASKFESYAADHCCGDQVLSHVMAVNGVPRYRGYDHTSFIGLQSLPSWRMAFGQWNWCSPLFNVHKTHQADLSRLYEFEKIFHAEKGYDPDAVMNWSYLFREFVVRDIFHRNSSSIRSSSPLTIPEELVVDEWDNFAAEKWFTSNITEDEGLTEEERKRKPWFSADGCVQACREWGPCLSWKFQDDNCGLGSTVSAGRKADEGIRMVSGYMGARIKTLLERVDCGRSEFIPKRGSEREVKPWP